MQVTVDNTGGLERKITIQLPWEEVSRRELKALEKAKSQANIAGFRPGKAPLNIIKQHYGHKIRYDVLGELMHESYVNAIKSESLAPAGYPAFEPQQYEEGKVFEFSATIEIFPEFELVDLSEQTLESDDAELNDSDIDETIEKLRQQMKTYITVERKAQTGDQVTFDFEGFLANDEPFAGNKAEDFKLVLGEGRMIPGFEDGLIGMQTGEEKTIEVTFPTEYHAKELAGQPAKFVIRMKTIQEPSLPNIDADFIKNYGIEDGEVESFRNELKNELQRELSVKVRTLLKKAVFDKWLSLNTFDLPQSWVKDEIKRLRESEAKYMQQMYKITAPLNKEDDAYLEDARRRVALGVLLNKFIETHQVEADPERVMSLVKERVAIFDDSEAMLQAFLKSERLMEEIKEIALEDTVVDLLIAKATLNKNVKSFTELMAE
jgi:trigger factor